MTPSLIRDGDEAEANQEQQFPKGEGDREDVTQLLAYVMLSIPPIRTSFS